LSKLQKQTSKRSTLIAVKFAKVFGRPNAWAGIFIAYCRVRQKTGTAKARLRGMLLTKFQRSTAGGKMRDRFGVKRRRMS